MRTSRVEKLEAARLGIQAQLDGAKTQEERNRLGQFATPPALAREVITYAASLLPKGKINFIDPAIGTGSFYFALLASVSGKRIGESAGFEIDPSFGKAAAHLWQSSGLSVRVADFTKQKATKRYNFLVSNPPYVRHHHIPSDEKARLQRGALEACHIPIGGLSGLYCYFLGLSHAWMAENGVAAWLIPSEFMDVNYGRAIKRYLLERVTLIRIHRFDPNDVQFDDALVSSAVVFFRNETPPKDHVVKFTFGGTLTAPRLCREVSVDKLSDELKWTRFPVADVSENSTVMPLSELFKIKRGLATGDNSFFILNREEITARNLPFECFTPILPGPRYVPGDEIEADANGIPAIERRLFLLNTKLSEDDIRHRYPALWDYLETGKARGLDQTYLCSHRRPWYIQEDRPAAPIVCTYMGRGDIKSKRPFRFILNASRATMANVYLAMYPTPRLAVAIRNDPSLIRKIWQILNNVPAATLLGEGRVYGGGLHKLEPKELGNLRVSEIAELLPESHRPMLQVDLFSTVAAE